LHFLKAYTEEQSSFIKKFSGNALTLQNIFSRPLSQDFMLFRTALLFLLG